MDNLINLNEYKIEKIAKELANNKDEIYNDVINEFYKDEKISLEMISFLVWFTQIVKRLYLSRLPNDTAVSITDETYIEVSKLFYRDLVETMVPELLTYFDTNCMNVKS